MRLDVRQLEMFRAVAEEGGFTRAAQRLNVSQSAVSRQVKLLEEELGGLLLHRTGKGVTLTGQGELLLKAANRIHRDIQDVAWQISETQKLQRGMLSLGGGMTVCMHVLPRLLKKFRSLYKDVDLRVTSGTSEAILRLVRNHQVDLGLLTLPIVAADLEVQPVLKEEMVVVTAPRHPLTRERTVDAKSLGRYPLVLFERGSNTRKVLDEFFLEQEIPTDVAMETENVEIIKAMVASGLGISVIPYAAIARDMRAGRFGWARLRGRRLYREAGWVYLKSDHVPRAIPEMLRVFDLIKDQFGGKAPH
jgi:DNA-binding transcriptional LysR family regulator